jgi:nitrite reductase (NO-forming)
MVGGAAARIVSFNVGAFTVVAGISLDAMAAVILGAVVVAVVVVWHAAALFSRMRRALPSRFGTTLRYYVAASMLLPVGLTFGVLMAPDTLDETVHARFALVHIAVNLLGWMGLTVLGTLIRLWRTMLHVRVADGAERASRRALPVLMAGIAITGVAAVAGSRSAAAAGLLCYLFGVAVVGRPLFTEARSRPPSTFGTRSVLAGLPWLAGSVAALTTILGASPTWRRAADAADWLAAPFLVGFAAQVLLGALSYLVPVVLGGGPAATRATNATFDTAGTVRLAIQNVATLAAAVPAMQAGRTLYAVAVLAGPGRLPLARGPRRPRQAEHVTDRLRVAPGWVTLPVRRSPARRRVIGARSASDAFPASAGLA